MILGMLVSVALCALGLLVALGYVGHPVDAQLVDVYGWSILIVGAALFVLFAYARYVCARRAATARRAA